MVRDLIPRDSLCPYPKRCFIAVMFPIQLFLLLFIILKLILSERERERERECERQTDRQTNRERDFYSNPLN